MIKFFISDVDFIIDHPYVLIYFLTLFHKIFLQLL